MNRIFRVIFNRSLGVWQAVSEFGKQNGKGKSSGARTPVGQSASVPARLTPLALALFAAMGGGQAYAVPSCSTTDTTISSSVAGQFVDMCNGNINFTIENGGVLNALGPSYIVENYALDVKWSTNN